MVTIHRRQGAAPYILVSYNSLLFSALPLLAVRSIDDELLTKCFRHIVCVDTPLRRLRQTLIRLRSLRQLNTILFL